MSVKNLLGAAIAAVLGLVWAGCANSGKQPDAALTAGGTNMAFMAEGTPTVSSAMPSAATPMPTESFEYTVQPGDSLWKIANKHSTSVSLIQRMNNMAPDQITIRVGDKIKIPGKADADRLRAQGAAAQAPAVVPTVTMPSAPRSAAAPATPRAATAPAATPHTATAPASSIYTSPGGTSWLPQSYREGQTAGSTPGASAAPAAVAPSATLSVTPPAAGASTTTPSLSLTPGTIRLSPSTVPPVSSTPPPASLQLSPSTGGAPASIGMTFQAVGPAEGTPAPAPAPAPAPQP